MPSGVLMSTFVSTTCDCASSSAPPAAAIPAPIVIDTKSLRVRSSCSMVVLPLGAHDTARDTVRLKPDTTYEVRLADA